MIEKLTCTKLVKVDDGRDQQGKKVYYNKRCGAPAAEVEIGGLLTKAKAILCVTHKMQADRENFVSSNGYQLGKISKAEKEKHYRQERLKGTGAGD